jgi:hypothetical protein
MVSLDTFRIPSFIGRLGIIPSTETRHVQCHVEFERKVRRAQAETKLGETMDGSGEKGRTAYFKNCRQCGDVWVQKRHEGNERTRTRTETQRISGDNSRPEMGYQKRGAEFGENLRGKNVLIWE